MGNAMRTRVRGIRVSFAELGSLRCAAKLSRRSVASFIREAALDAARSLLSMSSASVPPAVPRSAASSVRITRDQSTRP